MYQLFLFLDDFLLTKIDFIENERKNQMPFSSTEQKHCGI